MRAGKVCLCSACGTLVEIPADVVGMLVEQGMTLPPMDGEADEAVGESIGDEDAALDKQPVVEGPSAADEPAVQQPESSSGGSSEPNSPTTDIPSSTNKPLPPLPQPTHSPPSAAKRSLREHLALGGSACDGTGTPNHPSSNKPRRGCPANSLRRSFIGHSIDGLIVPSSQQLDQAFAWVSFHLKVLDKKESEVKRLKRLLRRRVPCPRPRGHAYSNAKKDARAHAKTPAKRHAQADLGVAPGNENHTATGVASGMSPDSIKPSGRAPP